MGEGSTIRSGDHEHYGHMLGPHVIGQRVVIRRLVPGETGPTGGPAFTDVLGMCEDWANGVAIVRREDGSTIEIPISLIVSGKPVPPRPSVRLRVSPQETARRANALFPDLTVDPIGEWVLRWEPEVQGRRRKRGSSCLAMGDPGVPFTEALGRVRTFYTDRGAAPLAQVELDSDVDVVFREAGWSPVAGSETAFLIGSLARARRLVPRGVTPLTATPTPIGPATSDADDPDPARFATIDADHVHAAAVYHRDWLGIHALAVDEGHRRQGLGLGAVLGLLDWGAEQGATTVWTQVEVDNVPSLTLFEGLAMGEHHRYHYVTPQT